MVEREWREAKDLRSPVVGIAVVVVCAAVLRFWGLHHGVPYAVEVDEPVVMSHAVRMMKTGDYNPHFFDYPALYIYLQLLLACARFLSGAMAGSWQSLQQVGPENFYLWGRALTALFGTATVWVLYQIGTRWGARHALLAAGLMAVIPLHVRESHFVLTDVPLTFFSALALLLTLRAHEHGTASAFGWAGAAVGLAAATKYNGLLALIMPLVAVWMTPDAKPSRTVCALATIGGCAGAFLIGAPYTVLDLPGFLNGFGYLAVAYRPRPRWAEPGWLIYLKHLRLGFRWPALLLVGAGLGLALVRATKGPGRARWAALIVFPLLYFYVISTKNLIFGRYLLPILPSLCLMAATAVVSGVSLLRRFDIPRAPRTALIAGLTLAALLPPAIVAVGFDRMLAKPSTQGMAYDWILQNIPSGSGIAIENSVIRLPDKRYRITEIRRLIDRAHEEYIADRVDYLVTSSWTSGPVFEAPYRHPAEYSAYRRLLDRATILHTVKSSAELSGPTVRIFKLLPDSRASDAVRANPTSGRIQIATSTR